MWDTCGGTCTCGVGQVRVCVSVCASAGAAARRLTYVSRNWNEEFKTNYW
jgi:hypothetical protein